jgi:hypothetical protein
MSETHTARKAVADIRSMRLCARPASAARWLDQVGQVVMEVHPGFGDGAALVSRFRHHGFAVDLRHNEGTRVSASSDRLDYAYCRRS